MVLHYAYRQILTYALKDINLSTFEYFQLKNSLDYTSLSTYGLEQAMCSTTFLSVNQTHVNGHTAHFIQVLIVLLLLTICGISYSFDENPSRKPLSINVGSDGNLDGNDYVECWLVMLVPQNQNLVLTAANNEYCLISTL